MTAPAVIWGGGWAPPGTLAGASGEVGASPQRGPPTRPSPLAPLALTLAMAWACLPLHL